MKKIFSFALIACAMVAGFASCSNEDEVPGVGLNAETRGGISFDNVLVEGSSHGTRGYATTAANATSQITSFQAWAYDDTTDGLYMGASATSGREVSNTGTALTPVWSYTPQQFWPVNPLNFVAVTPAAAPTGGTLTHSTASASNVVTLTSTFVNPTDVENQVDIMYASADDIEKGDNTGNVPFTFKHALSQIVFKGKFNNSGAVTKVTLAEISLCNVNKAGTLVYTSTDAFYGGAEQPASSTAANFTLDASDLEGYCFEYDADGASFVPATYYEAEDDEVVAGTKSVGDLKTPAQSKGTDAFDLTISENATKKNAWMMVPQTTAAWVGPAAINATPASGAYLKVRAKIEKDGVVILGNAEADALYIPLSINWDRSKKYIYTLEFNGANALTPITFSVAAQDWTDADPQPGDISF